MTTSVLRIPADTAQVRVARMVACTAARRAGADEDNVEDVRLATGEAVGRAVLRHQEAACQEPVTVEFDESREAFVVSVIDHGGAVTTDDGFAMAVISGLVPDAQVVDDDRGQRVVLRWAV